MSRVNDCEDCGHAYTPSYGQWFHTSWGAKWLCHPCAQARHNQPDPDPEVRDAVASIAEEMFEQDERLELREQLIAMGHPGLLGIIAEVDPELHELLLDPDKVEAILDDVLGEDES